jgi:hypothetical protein
MTIKNKTYQNNLEYKQDRQGHCDFHDCEFVEPLDQENKFDNFVDCKFLKSVDILPTEGSFIAWKQVWSNYGYYVLKLLVPAEARRVTPYVQNNRKCRVSKVHVLAAYSAETGRKTKRTEFYSGRDCNFTYKVGGVSKEPKFDGSRQKICTSGIHVFLTKQEAMDYSL